MVSNLCADVNLAQNRCYHFDNWRINPLKCEIKVNAKLKCGRPRSEEEATRHRLKIDSLVCWLLNTWRIDCCAQLHNRSKRCGRRHNAETWHNGCCVRARTSFAMCQAIPFSWSVCRYCGWNTLEMVTSVWRIIFCNINPNSVKSLSQTLQTRDSFLHVCA